LAQVRSRCLKYLDEVCEAHIDRFKEKKGRPQQRLEEILKRGITDFHSLFIEFAKTEGVYGFGDRQVKNMLAEL
jgi:hypothetical protein